MLLQEVIDDLLAVPFGVGIAGDVEPVRVADVVLKNELVEGGVVHDPPHPFACLCYGRYGDVCRLSCKMLAVRHSSHRPVQDWASVAGGYDYRLVDMPAERFEDLRAEVLQVGYDNAVGEERRVQRVVYAEACCRL